MACTHCTALRMLKVLAFVISVLFHSATAQDGFLSPQSGVLATGGEIGGPTSVTSADECASVCSATTGCISFNILGLSAFGSCGIKGECYAPNTTSCPATLSFGCYGGTFTAVTFASYGCPTTSAPGQCGWAVNSSCNAPSSVDVVTAACVGKSSCSIEVSVATFGSDPCAGVYKFLAVELAGNCSIPPPSTLLCQLNGYARNYNLAGGNATYYQRIMPRNDTRVVQAVPYQLTVPTGNVTISAGVLLQAFNNGMAYLTSQYNVDDMLYQFRKRAGVATPPGKCHGWDCKADWVEGSIAGLFLMGSGGHLRWTENPVLRSMMDELIDGIANCTEPDGFLAAFTQDKLASDEHPDYTTSWTVHGFLEAAIAGNTKAYGMIRAHMSLFNNHTSIPTFLPPDGGNWPYQTPVGPWPPGFNNQSNSGSGTLTGHTIYLISQGLIHNTRMALSPVGTQADVDLVASIYREPWWLEGLAARDLTVIGHKVYFSHNYQLTAIEAYLDMYILTGQQLYLDAVMGAWEMHRDPLHGWIHVGGSLAINEGDIYEPGSYHLDLGAPSTVTADGSVRLPEQPRRRDWYRRERGRAVGEQRHHTHANLEHGHKEGLEWNGQYPTGEFCGAVFWLKINQRLHRLYPDIEAYVFEEEREIYNEGLAHQGPVTNGVASGIRYFSNLNGVKALPTTEGTCCEGQGTRLYGSLNEYLFSLSPAGVYVDVYAPSAINFTYGGSEVSLTVFTDFPYGSVVEVEVACTPPVSFDIALRMPAWTASATIPITVYGAPSAYVGTPGSYVHMTQVWGAVPGPAITYDLTMAPESHLYTGVTQIGIYKRYAFTYGPILLAATSTSRFNSTLNGLVIPSVNGSQPETWLLPAGDGNSMHFVVNGVQDVLFQPAWEVNGPNQVFSSYPCFDA